jgi:hypothetical protein
VGIFQKVYYPSGSLSNPKEEYYISFCALIPSIALEKYVW